MILLSLNYLHLVRFHVLAVASMKMTIFLDIAPWRFGGAYCHHCQGDNVGQLLRDNDAVCETTVYFVLMRPDFFSRCFVASGFVPGIVTAISSDVKLRRILNVHEVYLGDRVCVSQWFVESSDEVSFLINTCLAVATCNYVFILSSAYCVPRRCRTPWFDDVNVFDEV